MIECKEDVVVWFRQLESYKRIDAMCTLLTSCLSFELRFLGTYLEDLASRDYEGLRSMELRVSNAPELVQNLATCQQAVPTDQRVRRMMAMYLALIRNVNRKCCNELYKTLELWGRQECMDKYVGQDELFVQELLLIYIMAKNHPVLGFEQRLKCAEIFQMLYEQMVVVIGGAGAPSSPGQTHPGNNNNEHPCPLSESPSPTMQIHLQQQQQQQTHSQGQTPLNYQQQQILHGAGGLHTQIPHNHHQQQQQHLVHQQQFLDSSATPSAVTSHLYGQQSQHPQLIQTTSSTSSSSQQANSGQQQFQQNVVQQQQAGGAGHIQVHPGHQLVAAYPQLIQTADGLGQVQQQQQQTQQPMSISMDQFQTVTASMPQYIENPFLTAAGTTVSATQNMVQWPTVTAYRHAAATIDTSIPPPQIPILPHSSTSSSSSQIISQSSSPTHSRTTSPVRVGSSGTAVPGKIASKRVSRRPSADQTTPPPPQNADMMANKTYDENPEILRNGYSRQHQSSRLSKSYSMHHHQQQHPQAQYQTAHHLSNFHVHPQYNFINHQLAHQQQQHLQQQQHQLIPGLPHGMEYVTYSSSSSSTGNTSGKVVQQQQHPATVSLGHVQHQPMVMSTSGGVNVVTGGGGGGAGSDSGSNSNDDCSPAETPTQITGNPSMVGQLVTSSLQNRLLLGKGSSSGGSATGGLVYVNSVSPNSNNSNNGNSVNSNVNSSNSNLNNNNSLLSSSNNELTSPPAMSSSPSPVSNPYGKVNQPQQRYQQQSAHSQMTIHGELMQGTTSTSQQQEMIQGGGGGDPQQQVYTYNNHHFVTTSHHHQQQQQQQHLHPHQSSSAHMLRTTGAPSGLVHQPQQIQSPPPPTQQQPGTMSHIPGMTIINSLQGQQLMNYSVLQQAASLGQGGAGQVVLQGQAQGGYIVTTTTPSAVAANVVPVAVVTAAAAAAINSCYNCGSQAHSGLECRETSMEDAIHHANYKLDYKTIQTQSEGIAEEEDDGEEGNGAVDRVQGDDEEEEEEEDVGRNVEEDEIIEVLSSGGENNEREQQQQQQLRERRRVRSHRMEGGSSSSGNELTHRFNAMGLEGEGGYRTQMHSPGQGDRSSASKGKF